MKRTIVAIVLSGLVASLAASCGHTPPPRAPGRQLAMGKCGACHLRPEPGTVDRAVLSDALDRHTTRAPMTDDERLALLDYLAPEPAARTARGARSGIALP